MNHSNVPRFVPVLYILEQETLGDELYHSLHIVIQLEFKVAYVLVPVSRRKPAIARKLRSVIFSIRNERVLPCDLSTGLRILDSNSRRGKAV